MNSRAERLALVARRVTEADPALGAALIGEAVAAAAVNGAALRDLATALAVGPEALSSGAPPSVGRLVHELRARGSELAEPSCIRCGRSSVALTASPAGGVCKSCRRHQLATACARCGGVKPVAGRDARGEPMCSVCAPRPRRVCSACAQVRIIARRARGDDGDLCDRCYKGPVVTCGLCGRVKACNFVAQGRPICASCSPRRHLVCAHCGESRPPSAHWPEGPVCELCYRGALDRRGRCERCRTERRLVSPPGPAATLCSPCSGAPPLASCRRCGAEERPYADGLCVRCSLATRARELLPPGPLDPVCEAIAAASQPYSAHNWLRSSASARILGALAAAGGPVSHRSLDAYSPARAVDYLRHLLVANGVLEPRDEGVLRLESWVEGRLEAIDDPQRRRLLRSYATWRLLRRVRARAAGSQRTQTPIAHAKTYLNAAIAFLAFLDARGRELKECSQADIDAWATIPGASEVSDFLGWAIDRKLVADVVLAGRPSTSGTALDDDTRWSIVARLLHDDDVELTDRVAGCLVLLYGQQLSRIVAITRYQISFTADIASLRLGPTAIDVPEPLSGLLARLVRDGRRYTGVGSPGTTVWLFPGLHPGRPLAASHLGERLRRLNIPTMAGRRGALMHLGARLPPGVLADLMGIAPSTAVRWVRAAGGDWSTYAAQVAKDDLIANRAE